MADIRCPSCGKNNPDFLDVCQFCQTPLKPEAMVHIGEKPTKRDTGELESALPEWLKGVREQSRTSAEEDAAQAAAMTRSQKDDAPPDLLAGLASQSGSSGEEEVPGWLSSLSPAAKPKPSSPSSPAPETDFFAQFNKPPEPPPAPVSEPAKEDAPSPIEGTTSRPKVGAEYDELSGWFSKASEQIPEPFSFESGASQTGSDLPADFGSFAAGPAQEPPAQKEEEDLSWLRDLEASAKRADEFPAPQKDMDWASNFESPASPSQPAAGQEDLSWLDNLGGVSQPSSPATPAASAPQEDLNWLNNLGGVSQPPSPAPSPSPASQEDLGWLDNLGGISQPLQPPPPMTSAPAAPQEDLNWLDNLGGVSQPSQPPSPITPMPSTPQEDLDWLKNLGGVSEPAQTFDPSAEQGFVQDEPAPSLPSAPQEDLSWLNNLGGAPEPLAAPPFSEPAPTPQTDLNWFSELEPSGEPPASAETLPPRHTAPLSDEAAEAPMPDWLRSATEGTSMPLGAEALEQIREPYQPPAVQPAQEIPSWMGSLQESQQIQEEPLLSPFGSAEGEPAPVDLSIFSPSTDSSNLSSQDVDSLFSVDMPDWVTDSETAASEAPVQETAIPAALSGDALSPVDLPSWVQAMRPVEAVISEAASASSVESQPTETEGPLAGLRGILPLVPIGSSRRPKAFSLKLQASDEQQAGAALLDEILAGETSPRPMVSSTPFTSQRVLRWALTGLFLITLGTILGLRLQTMPVSPILPGDAQAASDAVVAIPENSQVLIVIDYEPSLAGEMEAASGPLLDQMTLLRHPRYSFISTSPNGSALVERLLSSTKINRPIPEGGLGYQPGAQYFNLGYLPGGAAGALEFVEAPKSAMPSANVTNLSEYSAVILLTDHAESGRVWVEQLQAHKQTDPALASQPLLVVSSAQAGPLLQPYVSSRQVTGMVNGLSDAARYEFINSSRPGIARAYWDAFGVGLLMAIASIIIGSLWSLITGMRARRAGVESG